MGLRVSFELDDDDLKHFRLIMREARKTASRMAPEDIVAAAEEQLQAIVATTTPGFILERIQKLRLLINMLTDLEWRLPHQEATRVLNALAYFTEPEDLIPDHIPGVGFLDDAIMIELVVRELEFEIEAYRDFCSFRNQPRSESRAGAKTSREKWLRDRRDELQSRMRRRRETRNSVDSSDEPLKLFD
jgi:uncharacterized membrane protein YkvA (DUF1232 family)